jgi:hypothetical protein
MTLNAVNRMIWNGARAVKALVNFRSMAILFHARLEDETAMAAGDAHVPERTTRVKIESASGNKSAATDQGRRAR